jgi:multidrug transporter EmrE-like cation transporter
LLSSIPLILTSVGLNALAQILLKRGMLAVGRFELAPDQLAAALPRVALDPSILGGMACYALSIGLWLTVLSRVDLSIAYPFLSLGFVVAAAAGHWLFGEPLGPARLLGTALIVAGVLLIARA